MAGFGADPKWKLGGLDSRFSLCRQVVGLLASRWVAFVCIVAPFLAALGVAGTSFGGSVIPWRPVLTDLGVYRAGAQAVLSGSTPYAIHGLPFVYPPIAAVILSPVALLPWEVVTVGWSAAGAAALVVSLRICGLKTRAAGLVATGAIMFAAPIKQTFEFGQVGLFLMLACLVGMIWARKRNSTSLSVGAAGLIGVATAIKLTPALFIVFLFVVGRKRTAIGAALVSITLWVIGHVISSDASTAYWTDLIRGNAGLGESTVYLWNQSLWGVGARIGGTGDGVKFVCAAASIGVAVAVLLIARRLWHLEHSLLACATVALGALMISPVSWVHHYVWILPLLVRVFMLTPSLPYSKALKIATSGLFIWLGAAVFGFLPSGGSVELDYVWWQNALASVTTAASCVVLVLLGAVAAPTRVAVGNASMGALQEMNSERL